MYMEIILHYYINIKYIWNIIFYRFTTLKLTSRSSGWFKKVCEGFLGKHNLRVFQILFFDTVQLVVEFAIYLCTGLEKFDEDINMFFNIITTNCTLTKNRDYCSVNIPEEYFKIKIFIPYLDLFINEIDSRFIEY